MRTALFYDAVKVDGPKKKILEFNETDKFLDANELRHFESLCEVLSNKDNFFKTKISDYHSQVLTKLISLPVDKVFPCLDLYRIFLCHPDSTAHSKKFEDGANHLYTLCSPLVDKKAGEPARMLALRCLCNLFKEQTSVFVLRDKRQKVIEAVSAHLQNPKTNVRESAITCLLNFSIAFLQKDDPEGKIQILSALGQLSNETEPQCLKRLTAAIANLTYKNYEGKKLAEAMGFKL